MKYNPDVHRRSIRLRDYDYSRGGAYFVTICLQGRECLLGTVAGGKMVPNAAGEIVRQVWDGLPARYVTVGLDEVVFMPNHVHGIVWIADDHAPGAMGMGAIHRALITSSGQ